MLFSKKKKSRQAEDPPEEDLGEDLLEGFEEEGSGENALAKFSTEASGVLKLENQSYAVGLFWQSVSPTKVAQEAKRIATKDGINADFFCHPSKASEQIGLGSKEAGHKAGMGSLAAHLLTSVGEENWIGLFKAGYVYYLLAVRDNTILPETDVILEDYEEAIERFNYFHSASSWDAVYCPDDLNLPDTVSTDLENVLVGRISARLRPVDSRKMLLTGAAALVLLGAVFGGFMVVQSMFAPQDDFDLGSFVPAQPKQPQQGGEVAELPPIPPAPWSGSPSATSFVVACVDKVTGSSFYYPGWSLTTMKCSKNSFVRELTRTNGTVNWIEPYVVDHLGEKDVLINIASRERATISAPINNTNRLPSTMETESIPTVVAYLFSHMDEMGVDFKVSDKTDLTDDEHVYFDGRDYQFSTQNNPRDFLELFSRVNAMTVDSIVYGLNNKTWEIKGTIYERRSRPIYPPQK